MNSLDALLKAYGFELTSPSTLLEESPGWRSVLDGFLMQVKLKGFRGKFDSITEVSGRLKISCASQEMWMQYEISEAEAASLRICQKCGKFMTTLSPSFWYFKTLCKRHQK